MRRVFNNVVGLTFNNLTIIEELGAVNKHRKVKVKCGCGAIKVVNLDNLIKPNGTKSCGCYVSLGNTKHGKANHPLFRIWCGMKNRCYNPKRLCYKYYGAIGVTVCEEWLTSYHVFFQWAISNGWQEGLQLDKDINGDGLLYSPKTCAFVTSKVNCNHRKNNKIIQYNGVDYTIAELADMRGMSYYKLYSRLFILGWDVEKSLK